ncbi:MAG: hypothetical protein WD576_00715 [Nitriliruptoraceae bacterium]
MAIPRYQLISFAHLEAVAASTNAMLAFVIFLSRRATPAGVVDDVVFYGLNVGVIGFVVALTAQLPGLYVLFVPIMGIALLIAVATHVVALGKAPG